MVRRMLRKVLVVALTALAVTLGGCGFNTRGDASKAIARFLTAVHNNDRAAFEAGIDRPMLRNDVRVQLTEVANAKGVVVEGGPSEFAIDRMITPAAFRLVETGTDRPLSRPPEAAQILPILKVNSPTRVYVCDARKENCKLCFAKIDGVWRLIEMQLTDKIEVPPMPSKK